ncbi:hypothetical protein J4G08_12905 [Candidatus Poribacteria bacterium]|nr:hypothetical protein [Candidatus Poribacteria bacterium]
MKQKFFVLSAIALIAVVGLFVFEHATSAQRPDRDAQPGQNQRGNRAGGDRGGRDMMGMFNPASFVNNSWLDLSFQVKVDDETLMKARPIHQAAIDKFETKMKEIRESGDMRAGMAEMPTFSQNTIKELQAGLKEVLTKEELSKLTELMKKRTEADAERRNRFRGGQGQGGQRGQRPSQ